MSSHHIIREKQEPALIVEDLNEFNEELLDQLLEWAPTLIANDSTAPILLTRGINIDILVSLTDTFSAQSHVTIIPEVGSFLATALDYLVKAGYSAVNILSKEIPLDFLYTSCDSIDTVVLQQHKRILLIKSGYKKWRPANELIELHGSTSDLRLVGLKKEGNGRYRTAKDGFYEIYFNAAHLLLIESL